MLRLRFWSLLLVLVLSMPAWAAPTCTVPQCPRPPVLDGQLSPGEWDCAGGPGGFSLLGGGLAPAQPQVLLCRDDQALYVAARLPFGAKGKPKTTATSHDGAVWADDALEILLAPRGRTGAYLQFIVNAAGTQYEAKGREAGWNGSWTARTRINEADWTVEAAFPFASLETTAPGGADWAANFAWDRVTPSPFIACWAPVAQSLHDTSNFGILRFAQTAPAAALAGPYLSAQAVWLTGNWGPSATPLQATLRLQRREGDKLVPAGETSRTGGQTAAPLRLELTLPQDQGYRAPGAYTITAEVRSGTQVVWATESALNLSAPLALTVSKYWVAGKLAVSLDSSGIGRDPRQMTLALRLLDAGGREVLPAQKGPWPAGGKLNTELAVGSLKPGAYTLVADALDGAGKILYTSRLALTKPEKPYWLGSRAGIDDRVLPPWTPMKVSGKRVSMWGRTVTFDRLPFPSSVLTGGTEILAGPITFSGSAQGKTLSWTAGQCRVTSAQPQRVKLQTTATAAGLSCEGAVSLEYDGMIRTDLKLIPRGATQLDSLDLVIPLKPEYARYLYHWPGGWGSAFNAGALPKEGFHSRFKPFFWLGDEKRGLAWFAESDQGFVNADEEKVIDIGREGNAVVLRVHIISQPQTLTKPLPFTFGLQATPVKPMDPSVWDYRINHGGAYGLENRPYRSSGTITYPTEGNLDLRQGTFECWIRPSFDMQPKGVPKDGSRGHLNRNLLDIDLPGDAHVGFYWNIDDLGLRLYYKQGDSYPMLISTHQNWKPGEWHHVAFTWADLTRVYIDGVKVGERRFSGLPGSGLKNGSLSLGKQPCETDIDEIRLSSVARTSFDLTQPPAADADTLLLDHLDQSFKPNGHLATTPARGAGGVITSGVFAAGKFGQALVLGGLQTANYLDYLAEMGVRTVAFHEHWTDIEAYPYTTHGEQLRSLVQACHKSKLQLLLYHGYLLSDLAPEWEDYHDECLVGPRQGGYHRKPEQMAYMVCLNSHWQDFLAEGLQREMDTYGTDGVYLDGTSEPFGCENLGHGCGYVRPDGKVRPTYPFFAVRQMMKRIYTIVKQHNPRGQVNVHQSTCMTIPTLSFATSYWDGEQFGSIPRGPFALDVLPLDAFRCEFMGHNWGVPAEFLCYNRPYTYHEALSFTLLHDVLVRNALDEESKLWQIMDDFGRKQAKWLPYWENAAYVQTGAADVKVSLYSRPRVGCLALVSNLGAQPAAARVKFDLARLGLPAQVQAREMTSGQTLACTQGTVTVPLGSLDYAVLWLKP